MLFRSYVTQSPHADINGRVVHADHRRIADEDHIGFEQFLVRGNECCEAGGTDFFLAFNAKFDIDRQGPCSGHDFQGFHMHVKLSLVVCAAPGVYLPLFEGGFERATFPEFQRVGRLHIIMAVDEYGRF